MLHNQTCFSESAEQLCTCHMPVKLKEIIVKYLALEKLLNDQLAANWDEPSQKLQNAIYAEKESLAGYAFMQWCCVKYSI